MLRERHPLYFASTTKGALRCRIGATTSNVGASRCFLDLRPSVYVHATLPRDGQQCAASAGSRDSCAVWRIEDLVGALAMQNGRKGIACNICAEMGELDRLYA